MKQREIMSVVGARPHFIKAAPIMEVLKESDFQVFTVHTGQHYDQKMSDVFFSELSIPEPQVNLAVGSGSHGYQTAEVLRGVESLIVDRKPEAVMVFGDTNSTLGAALAAAKLYVPVVHIEAGVRCSNLRMPEEINRRLIDRVSTYLACPSDLAVDNLAAEGIRVGVSNVGDTMYDTFLAARKRVLANRSLSGTQLVNDNPGRSGLMTLHREETTRDVSRLIELLAAVNSLGFRIDFPAHPRTRASLLHSGSALSDFNNVRIIDPIGYIDLVDKLMSADVVLTDSGGLQKEAYWCGVPCVTLMSETTWMETVNEGWNRLIGLEPNSVGGAVDEALNSKPDDLTPRVAYGAAGAARRIAAELGWI